MRGRLQDNAIEVLRRKLSPSSKKTIEERAIQQQRTINVQKSSSTFFLLASSRYHGADVV